MRVETKQLKAFLLDSGVVSAADIAKAEDEASASGKKIEEAEFGEIIKGESGAFTAAAQSEEGTDESIEDLKKIAEDLPVVRIVDTLIHHAILQRASDIHIEQAEKEVVVRYRIDGILRDAMVLPKQIASG